MKVSSKIKKIFRISIAAAAICLLIVDLTTIWNDIGKPGNHIKDYLHPVLPAIILYGALNSLKKMKENKAE